MQHLFHYYHNWNMRLLRLLISAIPIFKIQIIFTATVCLANVISIVNNEPISNKNPIVFTKWGLICGTSEIVGHNPVAVFRGIPFAEPPVGYLRFKKPVPLQYDGKYHFYNAFYNGPACHQPYSIYPWSDVMSNQSENCLYLNIWTPLVFPSERKKAVLFWIHTGGFTYGSNRLDVYDGKVLSGLGDIIVVTTNHRLGPLGFGFSNSKDIPGNMGLYDILEALKWVHTNIHYFGGDNQRITLSGHSSGSMTTALFSVSDLSQYLFKQMIMQSGAPSIVVPAHPQSNYNRTLSIAKILKCTSENSFSITRETIACLKDASPTALVRADFQVENNYAPHYFSEFFPTNPRQRITHGYFQSANLLIGNNKDDGANYLTTKVPEEFGYFGEKSNGQLNKTHGRELIRRIYPYIPEIEKIADFYYGNVEDNDYLGITNQTWSIFQDIRYHCANEYFALKMSEKSHVYYYYFVHRPSNSPWAPWMGSVHFEEVKFVFGYPLRYPELFTVEENELSKKMLLAWTSFVKTGKPYVSKYWPLYSELSPYYFTFNVTNNGAIGYGPEIENCMFFSNELGFV